MNVYFKTLVNDLLDVVSCHLDFNGEKTDSGEYIFDGYTVYPEICKDTESGVIRQRNTIVNTSDEDITVNRISSVYADGIARNFYDKDVRIHKCHSVWQGEGQWVSSTPSELGLYPISAHDISYCTHSLVSVGSWSTGKYYPIVLIENRTDNITYFFEHQGGVSWEIELGTKGLPDALELTVDVNSLHEGALGSCITLKKGETYCTTPVLYGEIEGTVDDAIETLLKYKRNHGRQLQKPLVCYNDFMNCLWAMPDDKKLIPLIDAAATVGAEVFCIDDGWFVKEDGCSFGDWIPDDSKFGKYKLSGILNYISERGMIPGIWFELETCTDDSAIYNIAEDAVLRRRGHVINGSRCFVNFMCKEVVDYLRDRIRYMYGLGIRYIKNDYNHSLGIGCDNNNDRSFGIGIIENYKAFCDFIDSLYEEMPDLIIENCGSGAMRCDSGTLSHFYLQSVSDQENYLNMPSVTWGMQRCIPPEKCGIWAYPYPVPYKDRFDSSFIHDEEFLNSMADGEQTAFNMASALFGTMYISGHIEKCDSLNQELIKHAVECSKNSKEFIQTALPVNLYPQQGLYRKGYMVLGLKGQNKIRIGVFKNGGGDTLTFDLSKYIKKDSELKEIYPLKDTKSFAKLQDGQFVFECPLPIAARVFEVDI